ncbi:MAG: carbohydrate ABC transporter permease [Pseudomonadota bacterium]
MTRRCSRRQTRRVLGPLLANLLLISAGSFILLPYIWMILTSLKPADEIFLDEIRLLPERWAALENYHRALTAVPLARFMGNGLFVSGAIVVLQVLIAVPCGYALAKTSFRGARILLATVLLCLLIPKEVTAIPLYLAFAEIGILDTYLVLILPSSISVFAIFLFSQVFRQFPDEIIAASRLDGMRDYEIVWRVIVPNMWPAIGAFAVLSFVAHWNELYWPLIAITSMDLAPPPLGLSFFRSQEASSDFGALMAAATIISAPLVFAFLFAQGVFLRGFAYRQL